MPIIKATSPVRAEQFTGPESIDAVAALVLQYRTHASYGHAIGVLRFFSDESQDLRLETTDWAVVMGGDVAVMKASLFENWAAPELRLTQPEGAPLQ